MDENANAAKTGNGAFHEACAESFVSQTPRKVDDPAFCCFYKPETDWCVRFLDRAILDDDVGAFAGKGSSNGMTNS